MAALRLCAVAFALALAACVSGDDSACTETTCSRNETCCITPQGGPGCCPYQDAVCCLDGIHCCPTGTVCDEEHRRCINVPHQTHGQFTFVELTARTNASASGNEHCPDGSSCPEDSTCCMTQSEEFGCCPFPEGVCCKDKTHCCPTGSRCIGGGLCLRPRSENDIEGAEPPLTTQAAIVDQARRGGVTQCSEGDCPANSTCCDAPEGRQGCCPLRDAICCLDGLHCCPSGTVCDQDRHRCINVPHQTHGQFTFVELTASVSGNEHCPDGSSCPEDSTCCMTQSEEFGCCPFPDGVCCKDKTHCCPTGSRCIGGGLCLRPRSENDIAGAEPPLATQAAIVDQARSGDVTQCSEGDCPANSTCCDGPEGRKGCCPLRDAICCLDGLHCCPFGTVCDQEHRRCIDVLYEKKERVTFARLAPPTAQVGASNEQCPDGSSCPGVSTCCMTPTKHFGCCPFQNAMCCRDMIHCCPYGTRCIGGGLCQRQYGYGFSKAFRVQENEPVHITNGCTVGQQQCGSDQTCCEKSDGSVACCPMKDAVCCDGMDSCCPGGFVCSPFGCLKV